MDSMEIKPVNPYGNQPWILFIEKTDAEAEASILWPFDAKSWLIGEEPDAGKDWWQEKKGRKRMRWLDGITNLVEPTLGDSEGQGSLACCGPWNCKESDLTEQLNSNSNKAGWQYTACHTPFPMWESIVPCPVLTVASWLAYRFLRRQVRWSGISISLGIFHSLL